MRQLENLSQWQSLRTSDGALIDRSYLEVVARFVRMVEFCDGSGAFD